MAAQLIAWNGRAERAEREVLSGKPASEAEAGPAEPILPPAHVSPTGEEDGDEDRHSSGEDHCGPDADDRADAQGRSLHSAAVASVVHDDAPAR